MAIRSGPVEATAADLFTVLLVRHWGCQSQMIVFEPEHQMAYARWTSDHPTGFVLVAVEQGWFQLHRSMCKAISRPTSSFVTKRRRYCFDTEEQAMRYSHDQSSHAPLTRAECRSNEILREALRCGLEC